ncbi:hypothetical protein GCM10007079_35250 [Nocardiopsis terrae]|nr:hypothetical protein GCM10007079_35250 [Nocardiopsis terrae]
MGSFSSSGRAGFVAVVVAESFADGLFDMASFQPLRSVVTEGATGFSGRLPGGVAPAPDAREAQLPGARKAGVARLSAGRRGIPRVGDLGAGQTLRGSDP